MPKRTSTRVAWINASLFVAAAFIIVTMIAPSVFGLQDFRQWAGMYTDGWCQVTVYSADPNSPGVQTQNITAGKQGMSIPVWTGPTHNQESCAKWARDRLCGKDPNVGWTIVYAKPFLGTSGYFLGDTNVCTDTRFSGSAWFTE